jgi:hypothetical protein
LSITQTKKANSGFVNRWSGVQFPHPAPENQ